MATETACMLCKLTGGLEVVLRTAGDVIDSNRSIVVPFSNA